MADFTTVFGEWIRLCEAQKGCYLCLFEDVCGGARYDQCIINFGTLPEAVEQRVLAWAAEHPRSTKVEKEFLFDDD